MARKPKIIKFTVPNIKRQKLIGWGNGYVGVTKNHPWFGKDYGEISYNIIIHGGLTFGELITKNGIKLPWSRYKGYYVVGFDTCHSGDYKKFPKHKVEEETEKLYQQAIKALKR